MRIRVLNEITWYTGSRLMPGRAVRIPADQADKVLADYGDNVEIWEDWPNKKISVEKKKATKKKKAVKAANK